MPIFIAAMMNARKKHTYKPSEKSGNPLADSLLVLGVLLGLGAILATTPIGLGIVAGLAGMAVLGSVYCGITGTGSEKSKTDNNSHHVEKTIYTDRPKDEEKARYGVNKSRTKLQEKMIERKSQEKKQTTKKNMQVLTKLQTKEHSPMKMSHAV